MSLIDASGSRTHMCNCYTHCQEDLTVSSLLRCPIVLIRFGRIFRLCGRVALSALEAMPGKGIEPFTEVLQPLSPCSSDIIFYYIHENRCLILLLHLRCHAWLVLFTAIGFHEFFVISGTK